MLIKCRGDPACQKRPDSTVVVVKRLKVRAFVRYAADSPIPTSNPRHSRVKFPGHAFPALFDEIDIPAFLHIIVHSRDVVGRCVSMDVTIVIIGPPVYIAFGLREFMGHLSKLSSYTSRPHGLEHGQKTTHNRERFFRIHLK